MSDSPIQSLIDGLLNSAQVPKEDRVKFTAGSTIKANAGEAVKLLDLIARMPNSSEYVDLPQEPGTVLKGQFHPKTNKLSLDRENADLETIVHEGVHSIQANSFWHAMNAKATKGSDLEKFQTEIFKVLDTYRTAHDKILKSNPGSREEYLAQPLERMARGTASVTGRGMTPVTVKQADTDALAGSDLMTLIDLLPDQYKKTQKQLSRGY